MEERLVMGYWDCPYCRTKGIKGTMQDCPACGATRGRDVKFYMKEEHDYLSDEDAENKGKGADWLCPYCRSLNAATSTKCKNCGYEREEEDKDYFNIRTERSTAGLERGEPQDTSRLQEEYNNKEERSLTENNSSKKRRLPVPAIAIGAVFAVLTLLLAIFIPRTKNLVVDDVHWERNIAIEEYRLVEDSGWTLPSDAELIRTAEEIRSYEEVLDHYETKTRTYTEQVPDGTHTEYEYIDNGDGTFTERAREVQDYRTETRTEEYEDPVYVSVPVYDTKYYYKQWRWEHSRDASSSGDDKDPYWAEANLGENEREGDRTEKYSFTAHLKGKDKQTTYKVDKEDWDKITRNSTIKVKMSGGTIVEYIW